MADNGLVPRRHFLLGSTAHPEPYRSPGNGGDGKEIPRRNRQSHGQALRQQVDTLKPTFEQAITEQQAAGLGEGFGLRIEFESFPDIELAFESLASERSGIELLNVQHESGKTLATVFVPDGKLHILEKKITSYLDASQDKVNKKGISTPRHRKLLDAIRSIRMASIQSLWTDDPEVFPATPEETIWWEVWLPVRKDRAATNEQFRGLAKDLGFRLAKGELEFPERTVLLAYGSLEQMQHSMLTLNSISELRRAKETADFFDSLPPDEQPQWVDELLQRTTFSENGEAVPHICLLDTGINHGHPLLTPAITSVDTHTVEPGWGTDDSNGHGTEMAGLALLGNLTDALDSLESIEVHHRLESVKLLN